MKLGFILYIAGGLILMGYILTICACVILDIIGAKHPTEEAVIRSFSRVAGIYALIVFIYFIGWLGGKLC